MPQQREMHKQVCLGALGVGAVLGLPQLFVQPLGAASRARPAASASAAHAAAQHPEVQLQAASVAGIAPVIGLGLAGVAALAAKSSRHSRCSRTAPVVCHAFESELGVQAPVGFFDPLGFTKDGDEFSFKRRRSVEIKHGRISM
eukprot:CAMPEP_0197881028 /NCGR_PEP_ID=MMETSP1439-20131203/8646_1 /TAXON_ID=66791 /ORGANISM="Gonyaulax spinifera, Strain CCMP409" /LENGTH=143 /DNA_ID=CAMNT_0043500605 /DNA_START=72 /DNA_END=500 /DNA_ORIENTATION=+